MIAERIWLKGEFGLESTIRKRIREDDIVEQYDLICKAPHSMLLELTNICNDSCLFCANSKCTKQRGIIDSKFAKKILREAYEFGVREVGFYGTGESLLDKNLEEYISYAKQLGFEYIYITTNGALLTPERADTIVAAGIDSIKFSINAANERDYFFVHGKDEFNKVINNIKYLSDLRARSDRKFLLYISYVMTRYTDSEKEEFKQRYQQYVDDIVFYDCLNVAGCMAREVKDYLAVGKNARYSPADGVCSMIFKNLYITYDGYLTMCCTDFQNYLVVADLKKENLADAWNNQYAQNLRKAHLSHKLEGTLCYNCINNCVEEIVPLREEYAIRVDVKKWDKSLEIEERIRDKQS